MAKRMAQAAKGKGMFKQATDRLMAWSFSRWKDYEKCPLFCKLAHILRMRSGQPSEAIDKGTVAHQLADHFVRGTLKKFPKELGPFKHEFGALRQLKAKTEAEWAFDIEYNQVDWFGKTAWLRMKVDAHYLSQQKDGRRGLMRTTVTIVDYKTGKNNPEHGDQRSLYALGGFAMYPDAAEVIAEHWYLESGEIESDTFTAKQIDKLRERWEQRTRAMLADTTFAPRPGPYCRWCDYSKAKGGPCRF